MNKNDIDVSIREWAKVRREYVEAGKPQLAGYCDAAISLMNYVSEKVDGGTNKFTAQQLLNFFNVTI